MFYHVRLETKDGGPEIWLGLSGDQVNERIIWPYLEGRPIVVNGRTISPQELKRLRIAKSEESADQLTARARKHSAEAVEEGILMFTDTEEDAFELAEDITADVISAPPGEPAGRVQAVGSLAKADERDMRASVPDPRKVFVIHGRNRAMRDAMFDFLRALDLSPIEWSEARQATGKASPYVGEILDAAFNIATAVVALFTPDDVAKLKEELQDASEPPHETDLTGQARPNVLFETGMAMGRDADRTILVELGQLRPFSDVGGRHSVRMSNDSADRQDLANRLKTAGCAVDMTGSDWHRAGDFETPT